MKKRLILPRKDWAPGALEEALPITANALFALHDCIQLCEILDESPTPERALCVSRAIRALAVDASDLILDLVCDLGGHKTTFEVSDVFQKIIDHARKTG